MNTTSLIPIRPRPRVFGVRQLLDEAHSYLNTRALAELLLAVRRSLIGSAEANRPLRALRRGAEPAVRVYLRPIEVLIAGEHENPLPQAARNELLAYVDEVAARPPSASAAA